MAGVDAPEVGHLRRQGGQTPGQPWGDEARRILADRVMGQSVVVEVVRPATRRGKHTGRVQGILWQGSRNVNLLLVHAGLAWYYPGGRSEAPAPLRCDLERAEIEAREAGRGLWAGPNPEPP